MLASIFDAFVEQSPISVMMRGLMERVFRPQRLDEIFETHAKLQYTRDLLFSTLVNLLSLVVCGIQPSVNATYKAKAKELNVNRSALYHKLNGVEPQVSAALLRETATELGQLIEQMGGQSAAMIEGYQTRIVDGNALAATEHRLKVLQAIAAAPLPGKSLVVLDPALRLAVDLFPCEDGHAQERRLFKQVLDTVKADQLWIADRNMCTRDFLIGIAQRQAMFIIREHQNLPWEAISDLKAVGQAKAGEVWEQTIQIQQGEQTLRVRRIVLRLAKPTRHGDRDIVCLTNVPITLATPEWVVHLYRERWQVEGLFLSVTQNFDGEIETLGYPKAALFSFALALVAYNILATLKAALASVHGVGKIEAALSDFYVVNELQGVYRGMMIAIPPEYWQGFADMSIPELADCCQTLATQVELKPFLKATRKKKKKKPPRIHDPKHPHVSTAKLLSDG
ncbi:transposase family protein [Leptolyngbya sp. Heron Island J]|uniref:transposase n=1 Tax=Leptolyngbya sp. Heron Island J TaxID=1385935 RepID=UPI0003B9A01F|nr:transposase [Leptolyngbya sp. Heron Island J]ESA32436.1 transposase family protein [Leptolyngbya sp. Heron Island J]